MDTLEKYKVLLENESDLILSINKNYEVVDIFSFKGYKGLSKEKVLKNKINVIFKDQTDRVISEIEKGLDKGLRKSITISDNSRYELYEVEIIYDKNIIIIVKPVVESKMISSPYYYKEFFDISSNSLMILNLDAEFVRVNQAFANMIGEDKEEVVGKKLLKYIHPNEHDKIYKISDLFLITNKITEYEVKIKTKNMGYRVYEISGFLRNELVYIVARDISDNKALNQMLVNTKLNYQNMFNSIDDFILIAYLNGQIIYGNSAYYKKLGYTPSDLRKKTMTDLHPKRLIEESKHVFSEVIDGKRDDCTIPLVSKGGKEWPVHTKIWFGQWNNEEVLYALSKDLSKEEELLLRFNKVFQSNPSYMTIHSFNSEKIIDVNRAFLEKFNLDKDEVIGKKISDLGFKGLISINSLKDYIKEFNKQVQKRYYYKDQRVDVLHSVEVVESIEDDYILSVMVDITELNKVKEEVEQISLIQDILMKLATNFINIPLEKLDSAVNSSLALMGKFINTDRVYIFDYDFDKKVTSNTYEWCSSYATRELDNLQDIPIESINSWVAEHKKGNSIHIRDVSKLSDNDSVKEILQFQGIKSVLSVPMMMDGECIGFAGFDSVREKKEYSKREIRLLNLFVQMLVNVFSRKKQEDLLYSQIKEREILINEIHHRVKNNLQIISSFLYLQSQYTKNKNVKQILNTTNNRIKAMAILHEKIYKGDNLDKFSFKTYLEEINRQLFDHYGYDKNIDFELEIEDININLNRAIPIGLIINELVTNAVQHAFVGKSKGVLIVKVFSKNSSLIINIEDNGVGFNIEKIKEEGSLGLVIVDSLINQLGGSYNIKSKDGTEYHISLPMQNLI